MAALRRHFFLTRLLPSTDVVGSLSIRRRSRRGHPLADAETGTAPSSIYDRSPKRVYISRASVTAP
jgi:hypothetical protein